MSILGFVRLNLTCAFSYLMLLVPSRWLNSWRNSSWHTISRKFRVCDPSFIYHRHYKKKESFFRQRNNQVFFCFWNFWKNNERDGGLIFEGWTYSLFDIDFFFRRMGSWKCAPALVFTYIISAKIIAFFKTKYWIV